VWDLKGEWWLTFVVSSQDPLNNLHFDISKLIHECAWLLCDGGNAPRRVLLDELVVVDLSGCDPSARGHHERLPLVLCTQVHEQHKFVICGNRES
jgi:hypothetical protein